MSQELITAAEIAPTEPTKTRKRVSKTEVQKLFSRLKFMPLKDMVNMVQQGWMPCGGCDGNGFFMRYLIVGGKQTDEEEEIHCPGCKGSGKEKISASLMADILKELAQYDMPKRGREDSKGQAVPDTAVLILQGLN